MVTSGPLLINTHCDLSSLRCPGGESVEQMEARVDAVIRKVRRLNTWIFLIYDIRYASITENTKRRGQIREMFLLWRTGISVVSSSHVGSSSLFASVRDILFDGLNSSKVTKNRDTFQR